MRLVITGVGGFIGERMAKRSREKGWEVVGVDISEEAVARLQGKGMEAHRGDINDREKLLEVFEGADLIFHTAAIVDEGKNRELSCRVNVEGTRSVCEVAREAGVQRLVHLSSVMVYGFEYPEGVEEDHPFPEYDNAYNETKARSEEIAMSYHQPGELEVIVLRPGDVYGIGSEPWVQRPLATMKAGIFNLPAGGRGIINHVHVDNLIDAVFLAVEKDCTGEIFNITDGVATSCIEYFRFLAKMVGKRSVPTLPTGLLNAMLTLSGPIFRLQGKEPPATKESIRFLMRFSKVSSEKARRELGYEPRILLEEGMAAIEAELREAGALD